MACSNVCVCFTCGGIWQVVMCVCLFHLWWGMACRNVCLFHLWWGMAGSNVCVSVSPVVRYGM